MIYQQLPPFNPVANSVRSSVMIPRFAMSLGRVVLAFPGAGNSITKNSITEIVVKIGARIVFGPISGAELDMLNKFRGIADEAYHLSIDFCERDGMSVMAKEVGAIDIPALRGEDIFVEVVNNAGAGVPTLTATAGFAGLQFDPKKPSAQGQLIHKTLKYLIANNGGTQQTWTPNFAGAVIKRIAFKYTGADWTATANGNLRSVLCKKNGVAMWDSVSCLDMRFLQNEQRKVPQSRVYMLDYILDNVQSGALSTRDARSLQFDLNLTAADTITAIVECLDVPGNL